MRWFWLSSVLFSACNSKQFADQSGPTGVDVPSNDKDNDGIIDSEDCNDEDPMIGAMREEICDGIDNDCDGVIDNGFPVETYYEDKDGDGYGVDFKVIESCFLQEGYALNAGDCNDSNPDRHPGALELCNGLDDDCDFLIDDEDDDVADATSYYADNDGDGYGNTTLIGLSCTPLSGVSNSADCDDENPFVNPGADEICDTYDNDCDPSTTAQGIGVEDSTGVFAQPALLDGTPSEPALYHSQADQTLHICDGDYSFQIEGEGSIHLQGYDNARIILEDQAFFTTPISEAEVTVQNLAFEGMNTILTCTDCSIQMDNVSFENLFAFDNTLPAVFDLSFGTFNLSNATFQNNSVLEAFRFSVVEATISDSSFTNNESYALFNLVTSDTTMTGVDIYGNSIYGASLQMNYPNVFEASDLLLTHPDPTVTDNAIGITNAFGEYTPTGILDFTCAEGTCGTLYETDIAAYPDQSYDSTPGDFRGNVYTFQEDSVLERFGVSLYNFSMPNYAEFFVLQYDASSGDWIVLYQETKLLAPINSNRHFTDFIGLNLVAGETYALAAGWDCNLNFNSKNIGNVPINGQAVPTGEVISSTNFDGVNMPDNPLRHAPGFVYSQIVETRLFRP